MLKKYPEFVNYIKYNSIKNESLSCVIPFINYVFYPKGTYIFRNGDKSSKFYCVLKGKVSMLVKKADNKKEKRASVFESKFEEVDIGINKNPIMRQRRCKNNLI